MAGGSVFKVGEDVDIPHMLLDFTALAVGLVLFEKALHLLEHRAEKYPKYHEMINKIYRELMILGLIGLAIKLLKEAKLVDDSGAAMTAFMSADIAIFLMAIALIVQATCIFLQLRNKNKAMDVLELFTSEDLYLLASSHERNRKVNPNPISKMWTANKYDELMSMRLMRYLFLRTHALPELFPFAKYLRQAQDNQITHMIDVEPTTWLVVFLTAWLWYSSVSVLANSGWVGDLHKSGDSDDSDDRRLRRLGDDDDEVRKIHTSGTTHEARTMRAALAVMYLIFVWWLVIAHMVTAYYLQWCRQRVLGHAGIGSRDDMLRRLHEIAQEEASHLSTEVTSEALRQMQKVEDELQIERHRFRQKHHEAHGAHHDPGFQYLKSCFKAMCKGGEHSLRHYAESPKRTRLRTRATLGPDGIDRAATSVALELPYFSRRAWHFSIMLNLILNGLFAALFLQVMMFHMLEFVDDFGWIPAVLIPTPILVNIFVQTQIIRDFVIVSSIWRVDVTTLSDVIEHFTEVVELQTTFISEIHQCLEAKGTTIRQLAHLLEMKDHAHTGWIDVEEFRQVLLTIGFRMSFFRFNSVMKVLFYLRQLKVDYRKFVTLITLAEEHHQSAPEASIVGAGGMDDVPMLEYKVSMCASSTVMMQRATSHEGDAESANNNNLSGCTVSAPIAQLPHAVRPTLQDALTRSSRFTQQLLATNHHHWPGASLSVDRVSLRHTLSAATGHATRDSATHWGARAPPRHALPRTAEEEAEEGTTTRSGRYVRM